jgi:hypothetical protein
VAVNIAQDAKSISGLAKAAEDVFAVLKGPIERVARASDASSAGAAARNFNPVASMSIDTVRTLDQFQRMVTSIQGLRAMYDFGNAFATISATGNFSSADPADTARDSAGLMNAAMTIGIMLAPETASTPYYESLNQAIGVVSSYSWPVWRG